MGLILDSTVLIRGERSGRRLNEVLEELAHLNIDNKDVGISTISAAELVFGVYRADTEDRRLIRQSFVEEVFSVLNVYPFTLEAARHAGRLGVDLQRSGFTVAPNDLHIASTAISLDFSLVTHNVRHFQLIPGLRLIPLLS